MRGAIPPLPQYVFMAWCLVKHRDSFTFTFARDDTGLVLVSVLSCDDTSFRLCHILSRFSTTCLNEMSNVSATSI
jgi:hypothetical protein